MKPKAKKEIDFSIQAQFAFKFMYLGKNYDGLVIQSSTHNTIEEVLFNAMKRCSLLEDKPIEQLMTEQNFSRCGRTDKGVNSSGNVFSLSLRYNPRYDYTKLINNLLPDDIYILGCKKVDDTFDACFSCLYREYKYYFFKKNMNIDLIKKACKLLQGVHNFQKFCKIDKSDENWETKNYERRIYEIYIEKCNKEFIFPFEINSNENNYYDCYVCVIKGSAFLWHQVRCIMSILFLIGNGQEEIELINEMLDEKTNKEFMYGIADDSNLVLTDCVYEFINFDTEEKVASDLFFKLEKVYQKNLMQSIMNTHFFNVIFNSNIHLNELHNEDTHKAIEYINKTHRRTRKYTKMLQHKVNRNKDKKK